MKGWKALGNKVGEFKVLSAKDVTPVNVTKETSKSEPKDSNDTLKPGDTIELDL